MDENAPNALDPDSPASETVNLSEDANAESADLSPDEASQGRSTGKLLAYAAVIAVLGGFALIALFSSSTDSGDGNNAEVAAAEGSFERFEDLAFVTADGETAELGDFAGEPIVVNFFASWCAPCRAEIPHFESASHANEGDVKFLGINHDLEQASWRTFVEETEVTFETVFQPQTEIFNEIDGKGMPTTAFVSPDGTVQHVYTGVLDEALLQELIDEHLLETT